MPSGTTSPHSVSPAIASARSHVRLIARQPVNDGHEAADPGRFVRHQPHKPRIVFPSIWVVSDRFAICVAGQEGRRQTASVSGACGTYQR